MLNNRYMCNKHPSFSEAWIESRKGIRHVSTQKKTSENQGFQITVWSVFVASIQQTFEAFPDILLVLLRYIWFLFNLVFGFKVCLRRLFWAVYRKRFARTWQARFHFLIVSATLTSMLTLFKALSRIQWSTVKLFGWMELCECSPNYLAHFYSKLSINESTQLTNVAKSSCFCIIVFSRVLMKCCYPFDNHDLKIIAFHHFALLWNDIFNTWLGTEITLVVNNIRCLFFLGILITGGCSPNYLI